MKLYIVKKSKSLKEQQRKCSLQCLFAPTKLIGSIGKKVENHCHQVFLEKYDFIEDIEIFCSNFYEEFYDEECINLFSKAFKK